MIVARVSVAAILLGAVGCSTMQPVREPVRYISEVHPKVVYVTHKSRAVMAVANPRVSGDTLHGTWEGVTRPIAMPLSQVQKMEARQRHGTRTIVLIAGLTAFTAVGMYALAGSGSGDAAECGYKSWPPTC